MYKLNLDDKYIEFVNRLISEELEEVEVYIFGSRAQNNSYEYSDVDIALKAQNVIKIESLLKIKANFQNSTFPYKVDLIDLNSIDEKFFNIIKNDLVKIN